MAIIVWSDKAVADLELIIWHPHEGCRYAYTPETRVEFWLNKLEASVANDCKVRTRLAELDWRVITVWGCELGTPEIFGQAP